MDIETQRIRRQVKLKEIGSIASYYRNKAKIRVADLVGKTGYSSSLIYAFENGKTSNELILFDCYFCVLPDELRQAMFAEIRGCLQWVRKKMNLRISTV